MIKRFVNSLLEYAGVRLERFQRSRYERLKYAPRYVDRTVTLLGKPFDISDARSFYSAYREIFIEQTYKFESEQSNPRIIDCGSNHGLSILYFKELYPDARVTGVEADAEIFRKLETNLARFHVDDVEIMNRALWHQTGEVEFYPDGADSGRVEGSYKEGKKTRVKTVMLDELIDGPVDLLKIDIEGAETDVLCSSSKLDQVKRIFVEYHSFIGKEQDLDRLISKLKAAGFRYYLRHHYCSENPFEVTGDQQGMDLQLNVFAIRESV